MSHLAWIGVTGLLICASPRAAFSQMASDPSLPQQTALAPADIKWMDAPPQFIKGAKIAVLLGDPTKPGLFLMRFKLPANYRIAPHIHPEDEHVTVISGGIAIGMGTKFDMKAKVMPPGSSIWTPGKQPHFVFTKKETITQVTGIGPFSISYLHPEDDPSKTSTK